MRGRLRLAAGLRPLVLLGAARPRVRPRRAGGRARGELARARALRRRRRGVPADRRASAVLDEPRGLPAGAGPVWLGGFAFDADGGATPTWSSLPPASLVLPEVSLCRRGERAFLTVNAVVGPGRGRRALGEELRARGSPACASTRRCRCSTRTRPPTPRSAAPARRASSKPRSRAPQRGSPRASSSKVVLAREVIVSAAAAHDPAALFGAHARAVPGLLLLLLRHARGRLHRRQPRAAGPPRRRRRLHRRPRRLDPPQLRPRRRRPPRRAAAAQRQGPPRAADRRRADRPRPAPARGLGRGGAPSRRSSRSRTSSTWRPR